LSAATQILIEPAQLGFCLKKIGLSRFNSIFFKKKGFEPAQPNIIIFAQLFVYANPIE